MPHPEGVGQVLNLRPGYVVRTSRNFASVNGTPYRPAGDQPVLSDVGYYEVDVADIVGGPFTRFPLCIVDSTKIKVGMRAPTSDEPQAFRTMSASLSTAYPSGKVAAGSIAFDFSATVSVSNAVLLEIRKLDVDGTYAKVGEALAKGGGAWKSRPFALNAAVADLKLAIVFSPQDTVLG
jgi:hypothetical protein